MLKPSPPVQGATYPTGPISGAAAAIRRATAGVAESLQGMERDVSEAFKREQDAQDVLEATRLKGEIEKGSLDIAESFQGDEDYASFDEKLENRVNELRERVRPPKMTRNVEMFFEQHFMTESAQLARVIRRKKLDVMSDTGKKYLLGYRDTMLEKYANETNEIARIGLRDEFQTTVDLYKGTYLIDPAWAGELTRTFTQEGKQLAINLADVQADKDMEKDPGGTYIKLSDSKYLPNLPPKLRQDKREKAYATMKVQEHEAEQKAEKTKKEFQEIEGNQIVDLYGKKEYAKVYAFAQNSKILDPQVRRFWMDHSELAAKQKEPTNDNPAEYFNLLQAIVNPSLTDEQKRDLAVKVIVSTGLKDGTKKTLLNDLVKSTLFDDPWFKFAEKSIKQSLGWTEQMGFFNLKDPQKAETSYRDVVRQLITEVKRDSLKGEEIDKRARQLVLPKQMEVWNLLTGGEKKEKKEKPKYNVGQIYNDAKGRKAKYLGAGKGEITEGPEKGKVIQFGQ